MAECLSDPSPSQGPSCPVCYQDYSDNKKNLIPRVLPCGHTYCLGVLATRTIYWFNKATGINNGCFTRTAGPWRILGVLQLLCISGIKLSSLLETMFQ